MKFIVTSDWHLDMSSGGMPRFDDITNVLNEIVDVAITEKIDIFFFLGDLTNPESIRSHRSVAKAVNISNFLKHNRIASIWLTGNHDTCENSESDHTLMALKHINDSCFVLDKPDFCNNDGCCVVALPFTARCNDYNPIEFVKTANLHNPRNNPVIVIGHLNIEGISPGSETVDHPRGRNVFLPIDDIRNRWPDALVFNGHYHKSQVFNTVHIPGSVVPLTFGEEKNKCGYIIGEV